DTATYLFHRGNELEQVKDDPLSPLTPTVFGDAPEIEPVELPLAAFYPALVDYADDPQKAAKDAAAERTAARKALVDVQQSESNAREERASLAEADRKKQQYRLEEAKLAVAAAEARLSA